LAKLEKENKRLKDQLEPKTLLRSLHLASILSDIGMYPKGKDQPYYNEVVAFINFDKPDETRTFAIRDRPGQELPYLATHEGVGFEVWADLKTRLNGTKPKVDQNKEIKLILDQKQLLTQEGLYEAMDCQEDGNYIQLLESLIHNYKRSDILNSCEQIYQEIKTKNVYGTSLHAFSTNHTGKTKDILS